MILHMVNYSCFTHCQLICDYDFKCIRTEFKQLCEFIRNVANNYGTLFEVKELL